MNMVLKKDTLMVFEKWLEKAKKEDNKLKNRLNPFYTPIYSSEAALMTKMFLLHITKTVVG